MQRTKNQHYVSQFHLKKHTLDGSTIWVFDKESRRVFSTDTRNVASENGFYDLTPEFSSSPKAADETLDEIEAEVAPMFEELIETIERGRRFEYRDRSMRTMIGIFLAIQNVRTRMFRDSYKQLHEMKLRVLEKRFGPQEWLAPEFPADKLAFEQAHLMFGSKYLRPAVAAMTHTIWIAGRNDTDQPFYTSDAPLSRRPHGDEHDMALDAKGMALYFPLTARHVLILCERSHFAHLAEHEGRIRAMDPGEVLQMNHLQIWNSRRQIYCAEDRFDTVREYAQTYPDIMEIDRPRWEVV